MITVDEILNKVSRDDIMRRYFPEPITFKKAYKNPFRIDKSPGCTFKQHPYKGLIFVDWSKSTIYDCFDVCKEQNRLNNFKEIMTQIDTDFNLNISPRDFKIKPPERKNSSYDCKVIQLPVRTQTSMEKFELKTVTKPWDVQSLRYWEGYGIGQDVLCLFKVMPCAKATLNTKLWLGTKENPIYQYAQPEGMQLYRPEAKKENGRFTQNLPAGSLMGLEQLPSKGDILFITKSLKDVMVLFQIGIHAVAPVGESGFIKPDLVNDLKKRFSKIVVLFDNDESGIKGASKLQNEHNFYTFMIPLKYGIKDCAEFVKIKGYNELINLLSNYGAKSFF